MTISHQHPDHANTAAVRPLKERLNTFDGPGEYEVSGILVTGVRTFLDQILEDELATPVALACRRDLIWVLTREPGSDLAYRFSVVPQGLLVDDRGDVAM